jgi:hypothetical protein
LQRDCADLGANGFGDRVGRDVGLSRNRPHHSQSLGRDLNPVLPQQFAGVPWHNVTCYQKVERLKYLMQLGHNPALKSASWPYRHGTSHSGESR